MNQCFNIVYLAGGFTHALNDVLHGAERERLGVPVFKLTKDHWYPASPGLPRRRRKTLCHFGAGFFGCEHPFDACAGGVSLFFPCGDFADEALGVVDSAIQALAAEHSDLDLDHVGPAGMLRL
jgi:hypothetical protein